MGVTDQRARPLAARPIDESISRHMGLYAVARLAERHGVRVRLRAGNPQGLTALVWLPDSVAERGGSRQYGDMPQRLAAFEGRRTPGQHAAEAPAARPAVPSFTGPAAVGPPAAGAAGEPWSPGGQPDAFPQVTRTPT